MFVVDVTICIPAWNAEAFIDRTLRCARNQTLADLHIIVSIDRGDDDTARICRAHQRADARIEVVEQSERMGWVRNANFMLDQVGSEYFCFYFHDDVIEPDFVARLVTALRARPDAASAHCDMALFGASDSLKPGASYEGTAAERVSRFMLRRRRGSPLRSMTRRAAVGALRLPEDGPAGYWANEPYLVGLIAAGPALHLPEILYRRWDKRAGGLTDGWQSLTVAAIVAGYISNAATTLGIVDTLPDDAGQRRMARYAVGLFLARQAANLTKRKGVPAEALRHVFDPILEQGAPFSLATMPPDIQALVREREEELGLASA
jgi:glycosyltransferase involved in cell wall biosynthesis